MVSRRITELAGTITEEIVHTGQHYDKNMSDIFFDEMGIPVPMYHLGIGGGTHGQMTGKMLIRLEEVFLESNPDAVLVYGDTNSTLAGALAASKLHIPVIHVEAGLRSHNRRMPEEQNRVLTDHIADLLLCPTEYAVENLRQEGVNNGVYWTGDVMYDAALFFSENRPIELEIPIPDQFILFTLHRAENTDNLKRLKNIISAVNSNKSIPIVFPVHPRTRKVLHQENLTLENHIIPIEPISYLQMIKLERNASAILTDSGGVQKEAYFFQKPCGTLRNETEWQETVAVGANRLLGADGSRISRFLQELPQPKEWSNLYGDGDASVLVVDAVIRTLREIAT
jgi:UDP-GlcNAc3NAcA epimerase